MAWVKGREEEGEGGEEWLSFPVLRGQNRNPVPRSFFDPKPNGNACYASYCFCRARLYLGQSMLKLNKNRKKNRLGKYLTTCWSITYHKLASFFPFWGVFIEPDLLPLSCHKRKKKKKRKKENERKKIDTEKTVYSEELTTNYWLILTGKRGRRAKIKGQI